MAKAKKAAEAKAKKESYLKDNYVQINETVMGKTKVLTRAMNIRGVGTMVETLGFEGDKLVSTSSTFIPGVKPKTKKDWKYLIIDKGPKSSRGEEDPTNEED